MIDLFSESFKFTATSVWIELYNEDPKSKRQYCMVGLKDVSREIQVVHPLSEFISNLWLGRSFNTQRKHATNIASFMNFIIANRIKLKINHFKDLNLEHGTIFLNILSQNKDRKTVQLYERTLTHFYKWLTDKEIINLTPGTFIKVEGQYGSYYASPFGTINYPQHKPTNSEHMLPLKYIPLLLEIAILVARPIVLGLYMQIFGGLRVGEVVNLLKSSTQKSFSNGNFLVKLRSNNLRTDLKNNSGSNYTKKNRQQIILQVHDWGTNLFNDHISLYKDKDGSGALFVNRDGNAMTTESYRQYFTKIKKVFIKFLREHGNPKDKLIAVHLNSGKWSTHIGRGTFTNILADEVESVFDLAFMRGDTDPRSSLAYMSNTERMRAKIEEKFESMHGEYIPMLIDRNQKR